MSFQNLAEIIPNPDVLIIGGGSAGVAAAVGASKAGASVTLLEKNAFAGGKATAAYVGTICGLYYRSEQPSPRFMHRGFPMEFAEQLMHKSKSAPVQFKNGLHFLPYDHFQFMLLCDEWLEKSTASVCFHTQAINAAAEAGNITAINAMVANRPITFRPKAVIDTSGEDLIANFLNIESLISDRYQAAAQVFRLSGITETDAEKLNLILIRSVQQGIVSGLLEKHFERVSLVPGSLFMENVLLKLPLPWIIDNQINNRSELEMFSRKAVHELVIYLTSHNETFKNATLTYSAPEAGVRTGPRYFGKTILSREDVMECKKPSDTVAGGTWPIEFWEPGKNVFMEYFNMDDYYGIPATALQSSSITNLFFAGRNISADDSTIASARVIGTCLATGYAAGRMAGAQSMNRFSPDIVRDIQKELSISIPGK